MTGQDLARCPVNRLGRGNISEGKIVRQRLWIHGSRQPASCEQSLQFGPEYNARLVGCVKQGFLAHAIPGQEQLAFLGVPQCDRKHSAKHSKAVLAMFFVEMDDRFRVGLRAEAMATAFQFPAELRVVVNLPIQHHPKAAVFIRDGLMSTGEVYDAESAKAQAYPRSRENPFVVRTTMNERLVHAMNELRPDRFLAIKLEDSADSTQSVYAPFGTGTLCRAAS